MISINELYPGNMMTPAKAGLNMKKFTTLKELWDSADEQGKKNKKVKVRRERGVTFISELDSHDCGRINP